MDSNQLIDQAMNTQRSVASFMLRFTQDLWQDENGDPKVQWRGRINHVQGEEEIPFTDFTEALTFIQKQLQDLTLQAIPHTDPEAQEKALKESFKLWEHFSANYARLIFEAMENTVARSQNIQSQLGDAFAKTFELWLPPAFRGETGDAQETQSKAASKQTETGLNDQINDLTQQVQTLTEKIEAIEASRK